MKNNADFKLTAVSLDALVIGSGCAGFNAIHTLKQLGINNSALVTEGINKGTSRNTGSDKQTYYKLSLCSGGADGVMQMAQSFFAGQAMHGDIALCEAAGSVRSFMKLVELGVPFPHNEFGEYSGYKTDHDSCARGTSCGPLTSKLMTEKLELAAKTIGAKIYDMVQIVKIFTVKGKVCGALGLCLEKFNKGKAEFILFKTSKIIAATGGPASIYAGTVYPSSQTGMTGVLLECGAKAENLQEWQYGIASVKFKWNLSGSYQQVLPRYVSIDKNKNEHEFLTEYFNSNISLTENVFLKGYQWPFDSVKLKGSSLIDLAVYYETEVLHNKVYLDYTKNSAGTDINGGIAKEAYEYLKNSSALLNTPIERLQAMNPDAVELYKRNGIDLYTEYLEIKVCPQHNNGGIAVDSNWQSSVEGLYAAGEAAATFGVYRPGGAALNSTQVGSSRAARHIAQTLCKTQAEMPNTTAEKHISKLLTLISENAAYDLQNCRALLKKGFSRHAALVRTKKELTELKKLAESELTQFFDTPKAEKLSQLPAALKLYDMLFAQAAFASACEFSAKNIGSRAGALYFKDGFNLSLKGIIEQKEGFDNKIVQTRFNSGTMQSAAVPARGIPNADNWFESVWRNYKARNKSG